MRAAVAQRRFTVDEFHRMGPAGILGPQDRVELLEGQVVQMAAIGSRHAAAVGRLTTILAPLTRDLIVWIQNPVRLDRHTELAPDVAILCPRDDFYADAPPGAADVLLLLEVAESSLKYDLEVKVPVYGRAGISEVWVIDQSARRVHVFRDPSPESGFAKALVRSPGDHIEPAGIPDLSIAVDDILA